MRRLFLAVLVLALSLSAATIEVVPSVQSHRETEVGCIGGRILRIIGGANRRERRSARRANAC